MGSEHRRTFNKFNKQIQNLSINQQPLTDNTQKRT